MADKKTANKITENKTTPKKVSSFGGIVERLNGLAQSYSGLPIEAFVSAFSRAMANNQSLQNARVKAINPLPCDYTKAELGEFLRFPQNNELPLQRVSEGLRWSVYSYQKLIASYADILTFRNYAYPKYITADEIKSDTFKREYRLIDKIIKAIGIPQEGNKLVRQSMIQGKVFYIPRYSVDKSHNTVNYFFLQQLPTGGGWSKIIGYNNISKYTISFNLFYFAQLGTDYRQFGDLFEPYMRDFSAFVQTPENEKKVKRHEKFVYASRNNETIEGERDIWCQNGHWCYFVTLPIDRVWTFEIDGSTPIVASPLSGLMQTFAQQADYEAAQLSLVLNPLIKIFTGEIPYYESNASKEDDGFRLTLGNRTLFEAFWNNLMSQTNTSGTAFFTAPVKNISSHNYAESANANEVSQSFLNYGMSKSGTQGIIPITDRPTEKAVEASTKLEARYAQGVYRSLERMINYILGSLNLQYEWQCKIFGDIYSDEITRSNALKALDKGSIYAYFILAALDDISLLDMITMSDMVSASSLLEKLQVPPTSFTQSGKSQPKSDTGGRPQQSVEEKTEKETTVEVTDNV